MAALRAFTMPKWGIEMTEGTIAEWMVAQGAAFSKGDILTLIETDKITNEVEAEFDGRLARIIVSPGDTHPVGALLAIFATGEASEAEVDAFVAGFKPADTRMASAAAAEPTPPAPAPAPTPTIGHNVAISPAARREAEANGIDVSTITPTGRNDRITLQDVLLSQRPQSFNPANGAVSVEALGVQADAYFASPLAKRLAVLHAVDLSGIRGTGPRGRISRRDVLARVAPPAPAAPVLSGTHDVVRMTPMRKAIARALTQSKSTIPHFYLRFSARLDPIIAMRAQAKAATGTAPSINDYLVRAAALALAEHPDVNIQVHGEEIHRFAAADIAVAVETERGLITPILRDAGAKSVAAISAEIRALAEKARANRLQADEIQGGSFTISNLGMFGIENFDAIINPPQGAILAVGAGVRRPIEIDHALAFATVAAFSLSCDHRAIDGAVGARFCKTLKALIEEPARLTA